MKKITPISVLETQIKENIVLINELNDEIKRIDKEIEDKQEIKEKFQRRANKLEHERYELAKALEILGGER